MNRIALLALLLVAAGVAGFSDCGLEESGCSGVGCGPTLVLEVRPATWEPGTWRIDLGEGGSCTWTVPDPGGYQPERCPGGEQPEFWMWTEVPELTVSISRDGTPIGSRTIRPDYETSGDECLTCTSAREVVEF